MNNFNEKLTNLKIFILNEDGNNTELRTINHSDYMPFSKDILATFELVRFESGVEYTIHVALESENGLTNVLYAARYTPNHNNNIENTPLSSSEASVRFTLTILEKGTYKISLLVFKVDKSQEHALHSISKYFYFE